MSGLQMLLMAAMMLFLFLVIAAGFGLVLQPWLRAFMHGSPVSVVHIVAMRLRGNPPLLLIDAWVMLRREGVEVGVQDVENAYFDNRSSIRSSSDLVDLVRRSARQR